MEDTLTISALQHYAYCPRQYALIHVEQAWSENRFTAEGKILHERVDSGVAEQRRNIRYERGVLLHSETYSLSGKMDLLEVENSSPPRYLPVEYKRGKPKLHDWDRIQICAQAFCLEEMRGVNIEEGAIWYWEVRRREPVIIDDRLRQVTESVIEQAHAVMLEGRTPPPTEDKARCKACSLFSLCQPDNFRRDHSARYIRDMFES